MPKYLLLFNTHLSVYGKTQDDSDEITVECDAEKLQEVISRHKKRLTAQAERIASSISSDLNVHVSLTQVVPLS